MNQGHSILVVGEDQWNGTGFHSCDLAKLAECGGLKASKGQLHFLTSHREWVEIGGVVWSPQRADRVKIESAVLEMINLSGVPCINSAMTLSKYASRIATYSAMQTIGLPVVNAEWLVGHTYQLLLQTYTSRSSKSWRVALRYRKDANVNRRRISGGSRYDRDHR